MAIVPGKKNGKRDKDNYIGAHGVCDQCRATVYLLWIGNGAGRAYAAPMIKSAIAQHRCEAVAA